MLSQLLDETYLSLDFISQVKWSTWHIPMNYNVHTVMESIYRPEKALDPFLYHGKLINSNELLVKVLEAEIKEVEEDLLVQVSIYDRVLFGHKSRNALRQSSEWFQELGLQEYLNDRNLTDLLSYRNCLIELEKDNK